MTEPIPEPECENVQEPKRAHPLPLPAQAACKDLSRLPDHDHASQVRPTRQPAGYPVEVNRRVVVADQDDSQVLWLARRFVHDPGNKSVQEDELERLPEVLVVTAREDYSAHCVHGVASMLLASRVQRKPPPRHRTLSRSLRPDTFLA